MDDLSFFENISVELNKEVLMSRMKLREKLQKSKDLQWALEQAQDLIHPRALLGTASVTVIDDNTIQIDDQKFTSRILRVNLGSCERVFPFIFTIGPELENLAGQQTSLTKKFFLEMVGDFALTTAVTNVEEEIKSKYSINHTSSMTPGSLDNWGIDQQAPLFALFGKETERLGVKLSPSMVMNPRKSISGIAFHSEKVFINCQLCQRDRCPGRRAKFMPEKFAEYDLPIPKKN